jgi:CHAT domain-containing protein
LVTLSACRTALGKELNGTGVISLTSAFLHAGAARVLSTLWEIDDEAGAEFMRLFYERLLTHRDSPASALRRAQIAFMEGGRWQSRYFWGGYRLYGDWRSMW